MSVLSLQKLITFPMSKNWMWVINLISSMQMIIYFQWQFNQCATSKTKSVVCEPALTTPHSWHISSSHKLGIRHKGVFLWEGQIICACPQSRNFQKRMYKLQIPMYINIPSTMPQNVSTLFRCPATIKTFLLSLI